MLLPQALAICNEYDVRLIGQLYILLFQAQLAFSFTYDSSKRGGELDNVLHSLKRMKAEVDDWALLLGAEGRFALCALLSKHMQHALLLQTVQTWLPMKVCVHFLTSASAISQRYCNNQQSSHSAAFSLPVTYSNQKAYLRLVQPVWCWLISCRIALASQLMVGGTLTRLLSKRLMLLLVLQHIPVARHSCITS